MASQYQGSDGDLRSLYRRGSGLTLRRLQVLVRYLPAESPLWPALQAAEEKARKPTVDKLRERQAYWDEKKRVVTSV